jgi:hypothetical protein
LPVVVGSGLAVSVGEVVGDGVSLRQGSGVADGTSGGTDDSTIGPLSKGDGDDVGSAVPHGCGVGGSDGEAGLDAGCP